MTTDNTTGLTQFTSEIVSAYLAGHKVDPGEIATLILNVHKALVAAPAALVKTEVLVPAVPVKKSITPDFIVSLEDGRKLKSMRRYLRGLGMTPDEYRVKWGLPGDYPMTAPNYAKARSALAKRFGLGRKPAAAAPTEKSRKRSAGK